MLTHLNISIFVQLQTNTLSVFFAMKKCIFFSLETHPGQETEAYSQGLRIEDPG